MEKARELCPSPLLMQKSAAWWCRPGHGKEQPKVVPTHCVVHGSSLSQAWSPAGQGCFASQAQGTQLTLTFAGSSSRRICHTSLPPAHAGWLTDSQPPGTGNASAFVSMAKRRAGRWPVREIQGLTGCQGKKWVHSRSGLPAERESPGAGARPSSQEYPLFL